MTDTVLEVNKEFGGAFWMQVDLFYVREEDPVDKGLAVRVGVP